MKIYKVKLLIILKKEKNQENVQLYQNINCKYVKKLL